MNAKLPRASALLAAEMIGGTAIVGVAQSSETYGLWAVAFNLGLAISMLCGVCGYLWIYSKLNTFSVPQAAAFLLGERWKTPVLLMLCATYLGILSVEVAAASGVLSKMLSTSPVVVKLVILFLIATPSLGGLKLTSAWNTGLGAALILLLGMVAIKAPFGSAELVKDLPSAKELAMWLLLNPLSFLASQPLVQSSAWCESQQVSPVKAAFLAFPWVVLVGILSALIATSTGIDAGKATLFVAASRISPRLGATVSAAVVAAIVTTAPTILVALCTLTRELIRQKPSISGGESVRQLGIPLLIVAFFLSFFVKSIVAGLSYSFLPRAVLGSMILAAGVKRLGR